MREVNRPRDRGQWPDVPGDPIASNRKLLFRAHTVLGVLSGMVFISRVDLSHFPYWNTVAVLLLIVPPTIPYIVSALYSRKVVTGDRSRVFLFLVVLITVSILTNLLFAGGLGVQLTRTDLIPLLIMQTVAYGFAADKLFDAAV